MTVLSLRFQPRTNLNYGLTLWSVFKLIGPAELGGTHKFSPNPKRIDRGESARG